MFRLVCGRVSERSGCEANTVVCGVEDRVESFKESISIDEVKTLAGRSSDLVDVKQWLLRIHQMKRKLTELVMR